MGLGLNVAAHDVAVRFAMSAAVPMRSRWRLLRRMGWHGIEHSDIRDGCLFIGYDLQVAGECYFNRQVLIDATATVTIGRHVQFGPRAMVITGTHEIGSARMRGGAPTSAPVEIGDGCWVGAGAIILPGATVAPGCVIAAGAVVSRDTAPDGLYVGVPARRVKDLP